MCDAKHLILRLGVRISLQVTEKTVPPEHSSVVGALNDPPFLSHSAETLVACDPWREEGRFLGIQVDALVSVFLDYF